MNSTKDGVDIPAQMKNELEILKSARDLEFAELKKRLIAPPAVSA